MADPDESTAWPDEPAPQPSGEGDSPSAGERADDTSSGEASEMRLADLGPGDAVDQGVLEVADLTSEFPPGAAAAYTHVSEEEATEAWREARQDAEDVWPSGRAEEDDGGSRPADEG